MHEAARVHAALHEPSDPSVTAGVDCGVLGTWATSGPSATGVSLDMRPPGISSNPAIGDITIAGVPDNGSGIGGVDVTTGVADDPAILWAAFEATGALPGLNGVVAAAAVGAVAINGTVSALGNTSFTFVLSWYFPERNHLSEDIGALRVDQQNEKTVCIDQPHEYHRELLLNSVGLFFGRRARRRLP